LSWFHPRKSFSRHGTYESAPARTNHRTSKSKRQQCKDTNTFHDDFLRQLCPFHLQTQAQQLSSSAHNLRNIV
jgi:hypothetical protein